MNLTYKVLLFFSFLCLCTPIWGQSLIERTQSAEQVIQGLVIKQTSYWDTDKKLIFTKNTIALEHIFKGDKSQKTLEVHTLGGRVDNIMLKHEGLMLNPGDRGVFFVQRRSSGVLMPLYEKTGFVKFDQARQIAADALQTYNNIEKDLFTPIENAVGEKAFKVTDAPLFIKPKTSATGRLDAINITSMSPTTLTAGTRSVLTINGSGFKSGRGINGNVYFSNADDGGATMRQLFFPFGWWEDVELLEWTDTRIKVYLPTFAGSGPVMVMNDDGETFTSSINITVPYALNTNEFNFSATAILPADNADLVNITGSGGYVMSMNPSIYDNADQLKAITNALTHLRCKKGHNFSISRAPVDLEGWGYDGTNNIVLVDFIGSDLEANAGTFYEFCNAGTNWYWRVREFDILFNKSISWHAGGLPVPATKVDLESKALFAFARAAQLAPVNAIEDVMYYKLGKGKAKRELSELNANAMEFILEKSAIVKECGPLPMTLVPPSDCTKTLNMPLAQFNSDLRELCGKGNIKFASLSVNTSKVEWTFEGGSPATSTANTVVVNYTTPGTYAVKLIAKNAAGENELVRTGYVTVGSPTAVSVNLGPDKRYCEGDPIPNLDAGAIDGAKYLWSTGETTRSIAVTSPGEYWVEVNVSGCKSRDEVLISIDKRPVANAGKDRETCAGIPTELFGSGGLEYSWSPTTALSNPKIANPLASPTQTTMYYLTVSNGSGCPVSVDSVLVKVKPSPVVNIPDTITTCTGSTVTLDATNPGAKYKWSTGSTSPKIEVSTAGIINLRVDLNDCILSKNILVLIKDELPVFAGANVTICEGESLNLRASGATFYAWEAAEGMPEDQRNKHNPRVSPSKTTTYTVEGSAGGGCPSKKASITVTVVPKPALNLSSTDTIFVCNQSSFTLDAVVTDARAFFWSNGATTRTTKVSKSGLYSVQVVTRFCQDMLQDTVFVQFGRPAEALFNANVAPDNAASFVFENNSKNAVSYAWDFGDGATSSDKTPTHSYTSSGTFKVTLIAYSEFCGADTLEKLVSATVTGINDPEFSQTIQVYPNPTHEMFNVVWSSPQGKATLRDVLGREVIIQTLSSGQNIINVSQLTKGLYMLEISNGQKTAIKRVSIL
ncbi:MAG: PKD domain-containing protein [Cytophagales bacterium]|nr:MAG: PKD domain-containing protein [Cytophagales bacterium]TAF59815.1 MAG: PKD domain-containing protein [Cytophagales bacterium]